MQFSYSLPHFLWNVFNESGDGVDNLLFLVDPCRGVDDLLLIGLSLGSDNFAKLVVGDEDHILSCRTWLLLDDPLISERANGIVNSVESDISLIADVQVIVRAPFDAFQYF